ncbi:hypothetical protein J3E71DRAFT_373608 [Bipolaris maydis]|nr:hypothetical protein J3E71DRAFT_373608 [Bipolaris maydis]
MICSSVIQHAEANTVHIFYYFYSFLGSHSNGPTRLLRAIISQVIQKHQDLAIYVHDVYFTSHPIPTKKALLSLLPELLQGLGSVRLVIDGVDEWSSRDQKELLKDLAGLVSPTHSTYNCKIMIASRETMEISRYLRKKDKSVTKVSLSNAKESFAVTLAIANFVDSKLSDLPDHFDELDPDPSILVHVKETLRKKSHGMFLWVSLVLKSLDTVYSPEELRTIVDDLPSDLENLYNQIFIRLCSAPGARNYGGVSGIMSWICFAQRPLHKSELLHALSMFPYKSSSQVQSIPVASILDHCKPLIEELPDSTIVPVRFSVKEYFIKSQIPQVVPAINAALDISSACAIIITRSLDLLRFESNSLECLAQVASGHYRLLPYAIEFWIEHCLQYASGRVSLGMEQQFQDRLTQMHETHQNCRHALGRTVNQVETREQINDSNLDERVRLFSGMKIYQLIVDLLNLRLLASKLDGDSSSYIETYFINNDQTLFTQLSQKYESAIVHLLAQREVEGISSVLLQAFQQSYASTAFFCRFPHCDRLSLGFTTAQLRYEHEATHVKRVYCQTASCQYSRIGFPKKTALNAHTRKHHGQSIIQLIPAKVRNSKSKSENSEETSIVTLSSPFLPENLRPEQSLEPRQRQQYAEPRFSSQLSTYNDGSPFNSVQDFQDFDKLGEQLTLELYQYQKLRDARIEKLAKTLMQSCSKETRQQLENDVRKWAPAKKEQLFEYGVDPILYRFEEHARELLKKGDYSTTEELLAASESKELPQDLTRADEVAKGSERGLVDSQIDGEESSIHQEYLKHDWKYFDTLMQEGSHGFYAPQTAGYVQVQNSSEKSQSSLPLNVEADGQLSADLPDWTLFHRSSRSRNTVD